MNYIATVISNLRMDTSIYIVPVLQLLPRTVNVWGDAPLSQKMMEEISSQVSIVSR